MPLLGKAAMLLSFDVVAEAIVDHDAWHTQEHLPERLSIPGFLRGTRWVAERGQPRYFVLYEVASLATLTSAAYLERLNHPSAWTSRTMPSYRGMTRGFCAVAGSFGHGLGGSARLVRCTPRAGHEAALRERVLANLRGLPARAGMGSVHLLEVAATPAMTAEQRIRGQDAGVDWALLLTAYEPDALATCDVTELLGGLAEPTSLHDASYRLAYALTAGEARPPAGG